jgi:uncharacterized protein (TIGR02452 family)
MTMNSINLAQPMNNRTERARIAAETMEILAQGKYCFGDSEVSIENLLNAAKSGTRLYTPESLNQVLTSIASSPPKKTQFEVVNCTTFAAARQLADNNINAVCLNFASAKNPGGGFLSGSQAQEECLARASGLYVCLHQQMTYYEVNRACSTSLYTNHLIYSPLVPVFRDDNDCLLERSYCTSIITSPAVNAGAVRKNQPTSIPMIEPTIQQRIRSVLGIARYQKHSSIILGAWGCGVFGNDPVEVAGWMYEALLENPLFVGAFDRVVFAVLDRSENRQTFRAFHDRFA